MTSFNTVKDLAEAVETDGIVLTNIGELREMLGFKRLGVRVLDQIARDLRAEGLGYFPRDVLDNNSEPRQWEDVRIFNLTSAVGRVVLAVQEPSEKNDTFLLEASGSSSGDAAEILDQIRTLIGD